METLEKQMVEHLQTSNPGSILPMTLPVIMKFRKKSLEASRRFRRAGNECFLRCRSNDDFHNVYVHYAKSIAHAPLNSQEMALAYGDLSVLLLQLQRYSECLDAIDCCMRCKSYPEVLKFNTYLRKIDCLKILNKTEEATQAHDEALSWIEKTRTGNEKKGMKKKLASFFSDQTVVKRKFTEDEFDQVWDDLSIRTFNEEIPGASSCISLEYSEDQGRHFVATRDIEPGELIVKECPVVMTCFPETRYQCCWECLEFVPNCIPCVNCENVMYCSVKCKDKSWREYHHMECQLLPYFNNLFVTNSQYITFVIASFRIFYLAIKEYGSLEKLKKAVQNLENPTDPRTKGFTDGKLLDEKYAAFFSLTSFDDLLHAVPLAAKAVYDIATTTKLLGRQYEQSWKGLHQDTNFVFAATLIAKHMNILSINASQSSEVMDRDSLDTGLCLTMKGSLFNHSCVGNTFCHAAKPFSKVFAMLPIKKGEQVYIDYLEGSPYEKEKRQWHLQTKYHFTCSCVACTNDWPIPNDYPTRDKLAPVSRELVASIIKRTELPAKVLDFFENCSEVCGSHEKLGMLLRDFTGAIKVVDSNVKEPCKEIIWLQGNIVRFFLKLRRFYV